MLEILQGYAGNDGQRGIRGDKGPKVTKSMVVHKKIFLDKFQENDFLKIS